MHRTGNYNEEFELMELNERLSEFLIPNKVILTLYLFFGTIGNITVIYFYSFRLNSKKDNRFFIPWLAVVDLCACVIASSFALSLNIWPINFRGDAACKLLWFFTESITLTSGFMLLVIAIQRYLKVCRPFGRQMEFKWKLFSMFVVVVLSFVISAPVFKFYGEIEVRNRETNITGFRCGHFHQINNSGLVVYDFTLITIALVSVVCLTVLYGLIGRTVYIQIKKDKARKKSTIKKRKSSRKNKNNPPVSPKPETPESWQYPKEQSSSIETSDSSSDENVEDNDPEPPVSPQPSSPSVPSWTEQDKSISTTQDSSSTIPSWTEQGKSSRLSTTQDSSPAITSWTEQCKPSRLSTDILKINLPKIRKIRKKHVKNHFTTFRYNYMFMLITLVFVVSYAPTVVLMFRESVDPYFWARLTNEEISGHLILYRMFIINHVVNPFIYGFFDGAFRKEMKNVLCKCC